MPDMYRLAAGWLIVSFTEGFRLVDPIGRIYQVLTRDLDVDDLLPLNTLVEEGVCSLPQTQNQILSLLHKCTVPLNAIVAPNVESEHSWNVYIVNGGSSFGQELDYQVTHVVNVQSLPDILDGPSVAIVRTRDLEQPSGALSASSWLLSPNRFIVTWDAEGDIASLGPVLAPHIGTACPDCMRERLSAYRGSAAQLPRAVVTNSRYNQMSSRSTAEILATTMVRDIANRLLEGRLTSAEWYRNSRIIDTLTWDTSSRTVVRLPTCRMCRSYRAPISYNDGSV